MVNKVISSQFRKSLKVIYEFKKFSTFIGTDIWHRELGNTHNNILRRALLDKYIEDKVDENHVLQSLLEAYRRHYPTQFSHQIVEDKKAVQMESSIEEEKASIVTKTITIGSTKGTGTHRKQRTTEGKYADLQSGHSGPNKNSGSTRNETHYEIDVFLYV